MLPETHHSRSEPHMGDTFCPGSMLKLYIVFLSQFGFIHNKLNIVLNKLHQKVS